MQSSDGWPWTRRTSTGCSGAAIAGMSSSFPPASRRSTRARALCTIRRAARAAVQSSEASVRRRHSRSGRPAIKGARLRTGEDRRYRLPELPAGRPRRHAASSRPCARCAGARRSCHSSLEATGPSTARPATRRAASRRARHSARRRLGGRPCVAARRRRPVARAWAGASRPYAGHSPWRAVTTVLMPPRTLKLPTTSARTGSSAATRSLRMRFVTSSKKWPSSRNDQR